MTTKLSNCISICFIFLFLTACSDLKSSKNNTNRDDASIDSNFNSTVPKHMMVEKNSHLIGQSSLSDQCELLIFTFKNSSGRNIPTPSSIDVDFKDTAERLDTPPFSPVFLNKTTFSSKSDCTNNINGASSFTITSGSANYVRWIKMPLETTHLNNENGDYYFQISTNNSQIYVGHLSVFSNNFGFFRLVDENGEGYKLIGPKNAVQGQCYKSILTYAKFDGTMVSLTDRPYRFISTSLLDIYSDANCQIKITTSRNLDLETIYIKYNAEPGFTRLALTIKSDQLNSSHINDSLQTLIFPMGNESQIELLGPSEIPSTTCAGPYLLTIANQYGATLTNSSVSAKTINFTSSSLEVFNDSACTSSVGTSGSLQILANDTGPVIYLRTSSTTPSQNISFSYGSLSGLKTIYIND